MTGCHFFPAANWQQHIHHSIQIYRICNWFSRVGGFPANHVSWQNGIIVQPGGDGSKAAISLEQQAGSCAAARWIFDVLMVCPLGPWSTHEYSSWVTHPQSQVGSLFQKWMKYIMFQTKQLQSGDIPTIVSTWVKNVYVYTYIYNNMNVSYLICNAGLIFPRMDPTKGFWRDPTRPPTPRSARPQSRPWVRQATSVDILQNPWRYQSRNQCWNYGG